MLLAIETSSLVSSVAYCMRILSAELTIQAKLTPFGTAHAPHC